MLHKVYNKKLRVVSINLNYYFNTRMTKLFASSTKNYDFFILNEYVKI